MKSSKKRTLKKVFANVAIGLLIVTYFGNTIAGQFSGQINSFLGTSTSMTVTDGEDSGVRLQLRSRPEGSRPGQGRGG